MFTWPIESESKTQPEESQSPWYILNELADRLEPNSNGKFTGQVTEAIRDEEVIYALYIVVPKLRDYMYRLLEVRLTNYLNPYPVTLRFFAKDPKNNQRTECDTPDELRQTLADWIQSDLTRLVISALAQQIEIMGQYRQDSKTN